MHPTTARHHRQSCLIDVLSCQWSALFINSLFFEWPSGDCYPFDLNACCQR